MILITDITRGFKIFDRDIDTWVSEGWFPEYVWFNGRRYWDSDKFLEFMNCSEIPHYRLREVKNSSDKIASAIAIMMLDLRQT